MKNILNDKPIEELHGRLLFSASFVDNQDIDGKDVLDIGCGHGWFLLNSIKRGAKSVTGIELHNHDLETVMTNERIRNFATLKVGSATNLPFLDNSFDTVISWEVLEHIPKKTEALMFIEVARVLKPDGVFYLSTPHRSFWCNFFDPAWWLAGHRHYSVSQIEKYGKDVAFNVEKLTTMGGIIELLAINNLYVAKWIFRRKPFFEKEMHNKLDREWLHSIGFTNIFSKFKKL